MTVYEKNLDMLKETNTALYQKILDLPVESSKYSVLETKSGSFTIKVKLDDETNASEFFLHSKYDPEREAANFAQSQLAEKTKVNVLYGFGFGFHIVKILEYLNSDATLYVVEMNLEIMKLAIQTIDLGMVLKDGRVKLIASDSELEVVEGLKSVLKESVKVMLYPPSVKAIPAKNEKFKLILEQWNMNRYVFEKTDNTLEKNYLENTKVPCENIGILFNKTRNIPIIIVSAGPSLNKNKHLLKEVKGKVIILAAGSALKPLLQVGVEPDLFCIIDPLMNTYKQIEDLEDLDIPLVFLDTACSYTISAYEGPKYAACNNESRIGMREHLVDTGGSVATAILDMAIKLGGNPIIFMGQDLAYTNQEHHAIGSMYGEKENVKSLPNMRKVKGQNGEWLDTTIGYLSFKTWIENKISDNNHLTFINATEGGAYIEGCKHMKLQEFIDAYLSGNHAHGEIDRLLNEIWENATYNVKVFTFSIMAS
ncbi:MAG: DUF115 domain-containing protein [Clostridia bacterium]|nr:DUF115 domain-containing protein [Clostridia bacterium]